MIKNCFLVRILFVNLAFLLITSSGSAVAARLNINDKIADALKGDWGQITFNLRYRFEHVDQNGIETANGDPVRLRLGYMTRKISGFQAFAEFEGNTPFFSSDYNDKTNGKTNYAVIADPSKGELNQAWLSFDIVPGTNIKAGRQRILIDNQRFVGAVGWRQMEQTFDAAGLFNVSVDNFTGSAIYIWNVRTILSKDVNMSSPLLSLGYNFQDIGTLTGYGYWLDYDDPDNSGPSAYSFSTRTFGLRFNGKAAMTTNLKLLYTAEYAIQTDFQDNPEDYTAEYYHFTGGLTIPNKGSILTNITGKIAYEVLGSDKSISFKTPLGTNHGFNGWADLFLTAPGDGLRDIYGVLSTAVAGVKIDLIYHDFQADAGGSDYGSEFDARITKKFGSHYTVQAVYANYNADHYKTDTEKLWLQLIMAF